MALPCLSSKYEKGVKPSPIPSTIYSTHNESPRGAGVTVKQTKSLDYTLAFSANPSNMSLCMSMGKS